LGTRQHGNIKPSEVGYRARVLRISRIDLDYVLYVTFPSIGD
jgi:hypothetical protein